MNRSMTSSLARWAGPRRGLAALTAGALLLTACSSDGAEESETGTDGSNTAAAATDGATDSNNEESLTVTAVLDASLTTMNPLYDTATGQAVFNNVFSQLLGQPEAGEEGSPPELAESWETEDGRTWTFHLVPDVEFHNGEPLTAEDVVFTFETILGDDENPYNSRFPTLESITAVDEQTVEFQLSEPKSAFPVLTSTVSIVPNEYYAEVGKDGFDENPVGSGPFELVERSTDTLRLEAFDDYWGGPREIGELNWQIIESTTSAIAALEAGDVDVVANVPPGDADRVDALEGITAESTSSRRSVFLGHNVNVAPLDNPEVRQAIDLAIDRQAIIDGLLHGQAEPLGQAVPSTVVGHASAIEPTSYDPEAAADLVESSGYDGTEITMYYPTSRVASADQTAQAIVGYMQDVGLNVSAEPVEWATLLEDWVGTAIDGMYMFSYINNADAQVIIDSLFEEDSRNYFQDQEVFDLVTQQEEALTPEARAEALEQLWRLSNEQDYYTYLYAPNEIFGIRDGVPVDPSPTGRVWIGP